LKPIVFKGQYYGIVGIDIKAGLLQYLTEKNGIYKEGIRVTILTAGGKIIATTGRPDLTGKDATAISENFGQDFIKNVKTGEFEIRSHDTVKFFVPIKIASSNPWWVIDSLPNNVITDEATSLSKRLISVGAVCIALSILILSLFSFYIVRSLDLLIEGVKKVTLGHYGEIVEGVSSSDEIGDLATAFNNMSVEIKKKELERNGTEKALREKESYLSSIFRAAPTGIGVVFDRVIQKGNAQLCEMTGYLSDELMGKNARFLYRTDEDFEYVGRGKYQQIQERGTGTVETKWQRKDGKVIDVLLSSTPIDLKDLSCGVTFTALDITSRKKTEHELRESELKYRAMMEAMKDPVYICSADYRVEYMNPAMIKRTGRNATGEQCFSAVHDLDEKCPWCVHDKIYQHEHFLSDIVSPKDNRSYLISHSSVVHADSTISKITVFKDTTDYKTMESQLRQAQKMESIGTLAGGIAHDFNNILSPVFGYLEIILEDVSKDDPIHTYLEEVYNGAKRAGELVKQILYPIHIVW